MIKLSAVILAKTDSDANFNMTLECIDTLLASEPGAEIIVVESNKKIGETNFRYPESVIFTMPDDDFNFHKFLNVGIKKSKGEYVALLNNDLIFDKDWFAEILKVAQKRPDIKSFSPAADRYKTYDTDFEVGYKVRTHVNGWCLVAKREVFSKIGMLDETFDFNYADNDYAMTLKKHNIPHAVAYRSKVTHLENERDGKGEWYERKRKEAERELSKIVAQPDAIVDPKGHRDSLKFHNKWGSTTKLYRKNRVADLLIKYKLGFLNRFLMSL
ncbi:MAG: glycosyltransferase [Flavobacterium sp.]|uniref:glycosyltransferase family 2 protein n=1 Tax=Flavobacterium sp. TaxID=239 RepID=UPI0011F61331|nr:glycosyltransferase [Flavobacterium sp.]RZJ66078.1 MAG: glycosyltransferase [Flavobacterium sp.]